MIRKIMLYLSLILSVESMNSCKESTVVPEEFPKSVNHGSGLNILYTKYDSQSRTKSIIKYDITRKEYILMLSDAMLSSANIFSDEIPVIRQNGGEISFFNVYDGSWVNFGSFTAGTPSPLFTLGNRKFLNRNLVRNSTSSYYELRVLDKNNLLGKVIANDMDNLCVPTMNSNNSRVAYITASTTDPQSISRLVTVDINGENFKSLATGFENCSGNSGSLSWHEDLALTVSRIVGIKNNQITVLNLVTESETTLTNDTGKKSNPTFSTKGDKVAYMNDNNSISIIDFLSKDVASVYTLPPEFCFVNQILWSSNDRYVVVSMSNSDGSSQQIVLIDIFLKECVVVDTSSSYAVFY